MQEMLFVSFLPFPAWLSTCPTVVWGSNPGPMAANLENASCTQHWSWRHELLEIWCTHCPSFTSANPIGERVNIRSTVLSCMKSSLSSLWRGHARLIIMDFLNVYSGFPPASAFCCQCNPPESHHWSLAFERTTWLEIIHWSNDKLFGNYLYTSMSLLSLFTFIHICSSLHAFTLASCLCVLLRFIENCQAHRPNQKGPPYSRLPTCCHASHMKI